MSTSTLPVLLPAGGWVIGRTEIPPCNYLTALAYGAARAKNPKVQVEYFWEASRLLWNNSDLPEPLLERNPWSEKIISTCAANKYVALGGAASCGKSHVVAAWGIWQWIQDPEHTLILITSTDLKGAKQRVWKSVVDLLNGANGLPIKQRNSVGAANYVREDGKVLESAGLMMVAAGRGREQEAAGKLIGIHQKRVILICDELSELNESILQAGISNLANNDFFQLIGMSNPNSRFDPFGRWSEPKNGWDSIVFDRDYEWETKYGGRYVRFDGEQSPNITEGETLWPYLPTRAKLDEAIANMGESSRGYLRMYRAVFFDSDEADGVYNEADLQRSGALQTVQLQNAVTLAAVDPAFTNGGDRTVLAFGQVGYDHTGQYVVQFTEFLHLRDDATNKAVPRTYQIVTQIIDQCKRRGVKSYDLAVDATGAGGPFSDVLAGEWGNDFLRVQFGGKASERRATANSKARGCDLYHNRVTELWFVAKDLIRCRQIRGVTPELAKEMCSREYDTIKGGSGLMMRVETKSDMRSRMGFSPDVADAAFILIELARQRMGLSPIEPLVTASTGQTQRMSRSFRTLDILSGGEHMLA